MVKPRVTTLNINKFKIIYLSTTEEKSNTFRCIVIALHHVLKRSEGKRFRHHKNPILVQEQWDVEQYESILSCSLIINCSYLDNFSVDVV